MALEQRETSGEHA